MTTPNWKIRYRGKLLYKTGNSRKSIAFNTRKVGVPATYPEALYSIETREWAFKTAKEQLGPGVEMVQEGTAEYCYA